jgi:hypothetical protein
MTCYHHRFRIFKRHWRVSIMATSSPDTPFCTESCKRGPVSPGQPSTRDTCTGPLTPASKSANSPEILIWPFFEEKTRRQLTSLLELIPTHTVCFGNSSAWWVRHPFALVDRPQLKSGICGHVYFFCLGMLWKATDPTSNYDARTE